MMRLFFLGLTMFLMASACEPEWIPDPVHPALPKYTEEGKGVAGALVNNKLWEAKLYCEWDFIYDIPCKNALRLEPNQDGSLSVLFDGDMPDGKVIGLKFILPDQGALYLNNRLALDNTKFLIDGVINKVIATDSRNPCIAGKSGKGQLYFTYVKNRDDGQATIFSGTFGFEIEESSDCSRYEVYYGRFDYAIRL